MKISNNVLAVFVLLFMSIALVNNMVVFLFTETEEIITAQSTASVNLCINYAPVIQNISNQNTTINKTFILYLNSTDTNNHTIVFSSNDSIINISLFNQSGNLSIAIINSTFTNTSLVSNRTINLTADDNQSCTNSLVSTIFNLSINDVNRAPVLIENIPDQTWDEDTTLTGLDLDDYFEDPNNDNLIYNASAISNIDISIANNGVVTFTPDTNWFGLKIVTFNASDSEFSTSSNNVTLQVRNIPEPAVNLPKEGGGGGGGGGGKSGASLSSVCNTDWFCTEWSDCLSDNTRVRDCFDLNGCDAQDQKPEITVACDLVLHCYDGIQNFDEEDIDCGGTECDKCSTCNNGIKDGDETGVDCGGSCHTCEAPEIREVPCISVTDIERENLGLQKVNPRDVPLPEGFDIAINPFSLDCNQKSLDITVSVPENFDDVRILKCTGTECYPATVTQITELDCGGQLAGEVTRQTEFLDARFLPLYTEEVAVTLNQFKDSIKLRDNSVVFHGEIFDELKAKIILPNETTKQPLNPSLRIVGSPIKVKFDNIVGKLNSTITLPYAEESDVDEESIAVYVKYKEEWEFVGGNVNADKKTVTANLDSIETYLDQNLEVNLAAIGIICHGCRNSSLKKVHEPTGKSREAIILVHGLATGPAAFQQLIDDIRLTDQPFQTWLFEYPSFASYKVSANRFNELVETVADEFDRVNIVGHSLGGLITQEALHQAYTTNQENLTYTYLDKVDKAVLSASPNEGSPAAELYRNLFSYLVNIKTVYNLFRLDSVVIEELVKGAIIPRVPGVRYFVIAGTKPYEFNLGFFKTTSAELLEITEANDGLITVSSAKHIGEGFVDRKCENYWELNLTHPELIRSPVGRRLIEKIVSEEILEETQQKALLGRTNYYKFTITDCLPEDNIVVIGKKIGADAVYDPTFCSCGNGVCGVGETVQNCPLDCQPLLAQKQNLPRILFIAALTSVVVLLALTTGRPYIKKMILAILGKIKSILGIFKKPEQLKIKSLREIVLRQLDKIEAEIPVENIRSLSKEFTRVIRQYFKVSLNIEYEFTYEELLAELNKKRVEPELKNILTSFFKRIPEIEFGGRPLTKQELQSLIDEMREIVDLTTVKLPEDIRKLEKASRKKFAKITGKGMAKIYQMISQAELHLRLGEIKEAKKIYAAIINDYNSLENKQKKKVYEQFKRLFDEIKLASQREK